ncbi:hypothetical protein [Leptospira interrogans]|uniref:hypothetical protein n=2 Tax=Leptospira TaxID=171 RepID=UPI0011479AD9|nr:hypothetical protein [Leptospira interrogans]
MKAVVILSLNMQETQYTQGQKVIKKTTGEEMIVDAQLGAFQVMCIGLDGYGKWTMYEMSLDQIEPFKENVDLLDH